MKKVTVLLSFLTLIQYPFFTHASYHELTAYAEKAAESTGQIETFLVPPEDYMTTMKTISVLIAEKLAYYEERYKEGSERAEELKKAAEEFIEKIPFNETGRGSVWVWDQKEGFIVTNHHVVDGANHFVVTFPNGMRATAALVGSDKSTDIALLRITEHDGPIPPALLLKPSCTPQPGEELAAIGYPISPALRDRHGRPPWTAAYGRIIKQRSTHNAFLEFYQADANIIGGFSGGPLVSLSCGMAGMNTMRMPPRFVPSFTLSAVLADLREHGEVLRGTLGIILVSLEDAFKNGLFITEGINPKTYPLKNGIVVFNVSKDSPAARAGLKKGDVIIAVGDKTVTNRLVIQAAIASHKPGEKMVLTILRGTKRKTVIVTAVRQSEIEKK